MKIVKWFLIPVFLLAAWSLTAQTADEIIAKNIEAMGGREKLSSLNSVKMTGNLNVQGADVAVTLTKLNHVGIKVDIEVMGTYNYQMANAKEGWIYMPIQGMEQPRKMDEGEYENSFRQADLQGALFDYAAKGSTVKLEDKENVNRKPAYVLTVTEKTGQQMKYYIDENTNRVVKITSILKINGAETPIESGFDNYKQNKDGYWFAYTHITSQGNIEYDNVETNIPVDESLFTNK